MNKDLSKLGLGTVQWGSIYGVSNKRGQTPAAEVAEIIKLAREAGVDLLDTATLYGEAEKVLGQQNLSDFKIITKTPHFNGKKISKEDAGSLIAAFERSLRALRTEFVYALLVHNSSDILADGANWIVDALRDLKSRGFVLKIGVSIYGSTWLSRIYDLLSPDIVQLPINVLDRRLIEDGTLAFLKAKGVEIHSRSAFLQGLLLMKEAEVPSKLLPWVPVLRAWHNECNRQGVTPLKAALNFVTKLNEIDRCIVGVESPSISWSVLAHFPNPFRLMRLDWIVATKCC